MIVDPPPDTKRRGQNPQNTVSATTTHEHDSESQLHMNLNPGEPQRKPRSMGKFCLWILFGVLCVFGGMALQTFVSSLWNRVRHPHKDMYHVAPEGEVPDWAQVVRPMITKDSAFDVVASVWVRDELAKDGVIPVDGEEHSERLVYSGTVFKGVNLKSKNALANVPLRIPTSHFKEANLSNYDLRASFVLTQPNRPSWLDFAKNYTTWRPQGFKTPSVRKWSSEPTLEDEIYDSFGITIPLVQFHNITSRKSAQASVKETETPQKITRGDAEEAVASDEEEELEREDDEPMETATPQERRRNTFYLEFTGDQKPITEYHPYIVTRTHLCIVDETKLFKRQLYNKAQKELADKICVDSKSKKLLERPQWYQCTRSYKKNGVFETKVHLRVPPSGSEPDKKGDRKGRTEWLYAPFLSAMVRAPGPKDLVAVPIDREEVDGGETRALTPGEEYISVIWKLSFSGRTPEKLAMMDTVTSPLLGVYNMTRPDNELEYLQHGHDLTVGLAGYRIHEDIHPRRTHLLLITSTIAQLVYWFLTVHYWYTRTSTVGVARLGTAFLAFSSLITANEMMLYFVVNSKGPGRWFTPIPVLYVFRLIPPFVMLKAVSRLEFGWSTKHGKESWIPRIYIAKATHLERMSTRVERRLTRRIKLALLVAIFTALHFLNPSSMYLLTPRIPPPEKPPHPLHSLSPHSPAILEYIHSLDASLYLTGSILQFIMNAYSKTYAGKYKIATMLLLFAELLPLLDLVPSVVGRSTRPHGFPVAEGVRIVVLFVDTVQAVKYRNVKSLEEEDAE